MDRCFQGHVTRKEVRRVFADEQAHGEGGKQEAAEQAGHDREGQGDVRGIAGVPLRLVVQDVLIWCVHKRITLRGATPITDRRYRGIAVASGGCVRHPWKPGTPETCFWRWP